jgi:peptide methionine sulfoxide reductase MsrB
VLRGDTRTAANAKKTVCHLGHVYAEVGVYVTPLGKRNCMECRRMADRKRYARQA